MQSSNPVFRRSEGFNGRGAEPGPAGNGISYPASGTQTPPPPGYGEPAAWGTGAPTDQQPRRRVDQGRMTIDSVVQKTGITHGCRRPRGCGHLVDDR